MTGQGLVYNSVGSFTQTYQKSLSSILSIIDFLKRIEIPQNVCPCCGQPFDESKKLVSIGLHSFNAHASCIENIYQATVQQEQEIANRPNNYGKGVLGAFLGVAIGCVAWVVISLIGFISGWIALLMGVLASTFWDKFGAKNDKVKILVICVFIIVGVVLSMLISYAIAIAVALASDGVSMPLIDAFVQLMKDSEFASAFTYDIIMSIVFSIIGIIYPITTMIRSQRKTSSIIKK